MLLILYSLLVENLLLFILCLCISSAILNELFVVFIVNKTENKQQKKDCPF